MDLKDYLLESVQDKNTNESVSPKAATNKVAKFLKKEQMDMSENGFGGFGEGGVKLFVAFFKELIDNVLTEVNFDEFKPLNTNFGIKFGGISDSKQQRYFESALKPRAFEYAKKVAELCGWDADVCAMALNSYFKSQKVDVAMKTKKVTEGADEKVYIDFLNKDKKFKQDRKEFSGKNAYQDAVKWGRENLEKFNSDMIHYVRESKGDWVVMKGSSKIDGIDVQDFPYKEKGLEGAYGYEKKLMISRIIKTSNRGHSIFGSEKEAKDWIKSFRKDIEKDDRYDSEADRKKVLKAIDNLKVVQE